MSAAAATVTVTKMAATIMATVTAAMTTSMTVAATVGVAKKTKAVTHRQQSTRIGSKRNVGGGGDSNGDNKGNNNDGDGDSGNDNYNDGHWRATAATDGMVWGRGKAARGGGNGNKVEMGTMWV